MSNQVIKRVTKRESSPARVYGHNLIAELHRAMKGKYKFYVRLVGSAQWNTILHEPGKPWDVDYQIHLTKNSKVYKEDKSFDPTETKDDFYNFFGERFKGKNGFETQNSTTAVTLINHNNGYSFDFVIIDPANRIIRRNNNDGSGENMFTWNELKNCSEAYSSFKHLPADEKRIVIEEYVLPRKIKEKMKDENDPTKRSSSEAFIEEVNNYVARKQHR